MLEGIRIVDLTSIVFGPYATQILADLGAEVVKVESPDGDRARSLSAGSVSADMSPQFMAINRGKKSAALDLKKAADMEVLRGLIAGADVFIHNVRGRAAERLGLGYAAVRAIKQDIVYVHCVGYGQSGPYADLQAYDDVIQAASGTTSLLPRVDGNPKPRYFPSLIADKVAGLHAVYAVLAAVIHKLRTGRGQHVEVPMFESFTSFMLLEHLGGLSFDPPKGPACYARQISPERQPFPTRDGYVSMVVYTDDTLPVAFRVLGDTDFMQDERFSTRALRWRHISAIYARIGELTAGFTTAELLARLHAAQIPAQAARDMSDMLEDPHLQSVGFFKRREHPSEGAYYEVQPPVRFSDAPALELAMPPRLGEHTEELREGAR
jgi:crotonobetainyl-CoA:carnitine CoA-transferase CaiB-like acyl-CoA transferase